MKTRSRGINLVLLLGGAIVSGLLTGHLLSRLSSLPDEAALLDLAQAAGVPAGLVHSNKGVVEDEQLNHRGHCVYYEKAEIGRHPVQRSEFRLSKTEALRKWPTPFVGEHTRYVCGEILGMPASEIDPLIADGVLEVPPPELLAT